jgi:hypothetical protein
MPTLNCHIELDCQIRQLRTKIFILSQKLHTFANIELQLPPEILTIIFLHAHDDARATELTLVDLTSI